MKVTATTFPWSWISETRPLSWDVRVNGGAGPIIVRPAVPAIAWTGTRVITAAPIRAIKPHAGRALTLTFQLPLQLVQEAPVGALRDDLLWAGFDHPGFVKSKGVEAHRVLRIVLPPDVIANLLHRLKGVGVVRCEPLVHDESRGPVRLEGAHVGRFEDRPHRTLRGDWVRPDEVPIAGYDATEIFGPRPIYAAVDHEVTDLLRPQFLGLRWKGQ